MAKNNKSIFVLLCVFIFFCLLFVNVGAKPYITNQYKMSPSVFSVQIFDTNYFYTPSVIIPYSYSNYNIISVPFATSDGSNPTARLDGYFLLGGEYSDDVEFIFTDVDDYGSGALTISVNGNIFVYSINGNYVVAEDYVHYDNSVVADLYNFADNEYSLSSLFFNDMVLYAEQIIEFDDSYSILFVGTINLEGETGGNVNISINAGTPRTDQNGNLPIQNYQYNNVIFASDKQIYANGVYRPWNYNYNNELIIRDVNVRVADINDTLSLSAIYNNVSVFLNTPFFGIFTFGEVGAFVLALSVLMVILKFAYGG